MGTGRGRAGRVLIGPLGRPRLVGGVGSGGAARHLGVHDLDDSVMPWITRGNPQTTVVTIAERAADLLRGRDGATAGGPGGGPQPSDA